MRNDPLLLMEQTLQGLEEEQSGRSPEVQRDYDFVVIALRAAIAYYRAWIINIDILVAPDLDIPKEYRID